MQNHQRILHEGLQLVLAGVDRDRCDEPAVFADVLHDGFVVGDAAREDDGVDLARERCGHCPDLLGDVVAHGVEHHAGAVVALLDALHHLQNGVRAEIGHQSALARNVFQQLLARVLSREADLDQLARRDAARTVRSEGPVAVEGVVHVDDAPLAVCRHGDAAAHVGHDEVRFLVDEARALAVQAGGRLLVQGVEDRLALAHRHARDAGRVVHLVDDRRIGDVGLDAGAGHVGDLGRQQATEVAGVFHLGVPQVVAHARVHLVDAGRNGTDESAAADDGREPVDVEVVVAQRLEDQPPAPVELVDDVGEAGEFLRGVRERQFQQRPLLFVEGDLRGCRAGIYCQYDVAHKILGSGFRFGW